VINNTRKLLAVLLALCATLSAPANVLANGGPGESYDLIVGGNIKFENTPDIYVENEDLSIRFMPREHLVRVEYTLVNTGDQREIDYYFPLTSHESEYSNTSASWIGFYDNGKRLPSTLMTEEIESESSINLYEDDPAVQKALAGIVMPEDERKMEYNYYDTTASFYHTVLSFAEGETKKLTVVYRMSNHFSSWGTSKSPLMTFSDVVFLYDFRPAASWGDGKAKNFKLTIDYTGILPAWSYYCSLGNFKADSGGQYVYGAKNFDFAENGVLAFVFDYPFTYEGGGRPISDAVSMLYTSDTLADANDRYSPANLFDNDINTAWATDKGEGAVIEVLFEKGFRSDGFSLAILNGFTASRKLYYDNARIKKLKLEWGELHNGEWNVEGEEIYELPDRDYDELDINFIIINTENLRAATFSRITILETYPGRKYNDLCISEIFALGYSPYNYYNGEKFPEGFEIVGEPINAEQVEARQAVLNPTPTPTPLPTITPSPRETATPRPTNSPTPVPSTEVTATPQPAQDNNSFQTVAAVAACFGTAGFFGGVYFGKKRQK